MHRQTGSVRVSTCALTCLFVMSVSAVQIWQVGPTQHNQTKPQISGSMSTRKETSSAERHNRPAMHLANLPHSMREIHIPRGTSFAAADRDLAPFTAARRPVLANIATLIPSGENPIAVCIPTDLSAFEGTTAFVSNSEPAETAPNDLPAEALELRFRGLVNWENLHERLAILQATETASWKQEVVQQLENLNRSQSWGSREAGQAIRRLQELRQEEALKPIFAKLNDATEASRLGMAAYAIERRADVWYRMHLAMQPDVADRVRSEQAYCQRNNMLSTINAVEGLFPNTQVGNDWRKFLGLTAVRNTVVQEDKEQLQIRIGIAAEVLRQINAADLSSDQKRYFQHADVKAYLHLLHRIVTHPLTLEGLADCMEGVERDPSQVTGGCLARHWQQLRFATVTEYQQIAKAIDVHYRNANLRLCVTNDFLNRFLPAIEHVRGPVRENILGADVTGQSDALNQLRVRLVPDPDEVKLKLEVAGVMDSKTRSTHGGIVMFNQNRSRYLVSKLFAFNEGGMQVGTTRANAEAATSLRGMTTKYDALPLVGPMFRRIAQQRHQETKPLTQRIIGDRVAARVKQMTDAKLEEQMIQARQRLEQSIVQPLQEMELQPEALAMQTTEDRIVVRGRLAGGDQIAAFTTRPRAVSENLCSIQVHESAMNNLIDRLSLSGRTVELRTLIREILDQWDLKDTPIPEEVPENVQLTMAEDRPVEIRCRDDQLTFAIRVKRLNSPNGTWKNFEVQARFVPQTDGFRCDLVRDGNLEIASIGNRPLGGRARFALSAIFTRVFSKNQRLPLINEELSNDPRLANLDVDQVVIRDGWVGVSVGEKTPTVTAHRGANRRR
jgi:hypothetical protein